MKTTWLERTLLRAENQAEGKDKDVCMELVNLYRTDRPLAALAYAYRVRRLGEDIEVAPLEAAVERLRQSDWASDPAGAYKLGMELAARPSEDRDVMKAVAYLETAAKCDDPGLAGMASFQLAEFLRSLVGPNVNYRQLSYHYYAKAHELGFYDILYFDMPGNPDVAQSAS